MKEMLSASQEDYLEAIFRIVGEKQAVRAKDIAQRLGVSNSSVTGALRILAEKGLINYAPYDVIALTAEGRKVSEDVVRRHEALQDFFIKVLSVDEDVATAVGVSQQELAREFATLRDMEILRGLRRGGKIYFALFEKKT